jgi:hypothetical protein
MSDSHFMVQVCADDDHDWQEIAPDKFKCRKCPMEMTIEKAGEKAVDFELANAGGRA